MQPAVGGLQHAGFGAEGFELGQFLLQGLAHAQGIAGHHFVAVRDQGFEGFVVGHRLDAAEGQLGRGLLHPGQAQGTERADVEPANVKLIGLDRELGRGGVGVVVVVQLFTANQDTPGAEIGAGVGRLKVAVTPPVAKAVDDAGSGHRNPGHLHCPDRQAGCTKQGEVNNHHQPHALPGVAGVEVALDPVVRGAVAITGHGFLVFGFGPVEFGALPEHFLDAEDLRAVGVTFLLALGVVLAVNRGPLLGDLTGG